MRFAIFLIAALSGVVGLAGPAGASGHQRVVDHVTDGDTIVLRGGERVRLVQIDAPEAASGRECYGVESAAAIKRMLPAGSRVRVATDAGLDQRDSYGRMLAYVWRGSSMVNLRLVRDGAAAPYFYRGEEGRYAQVLFKAAVAARKAGKGLWGRCRAGAVPLSPTSAIATGTVAAANPKPSPPRLVSPSSPPSASNCNPNYSPCVPNSSSDLDCADIGRMVRVIGYDPYRLDREGDGIGCESYG